MYLPEHIDGRKFCQKWLCLEPALEVPHIEGRKHQENRRCLNELWKSSTSMSGDTSKIYPSEKKTEKELGGSSTSRVRNTKKNDTARTSSEHAAYREAEKQAKSTLPKRALEPQHIKAGNAEKLDSPPRELWKCSISRPGNTSRNGPSRNKLWVPAQQQQPARDSLWANVTSYSPQQKSTARIASLLSCIIHGCSDTMFPSVATSS